MKEMKKYFVEYKDGGDYGCGEEIMAESEDHAVRLVQMELLKEDDYMNRLVCVQELFEEDEDEESNDSFLNMVNGDGMTLKQVWDKEIEDNK